MKIEEVQALVRGTATPVSARGGGTKTGLAAGGEATTLDLSQLSGVVAYDPGEFTFTALAGTRLSEVEAVLAEHGQYLPFDPPLASRGATLGGTVAAGLSGPGRYRFGGVRDFILGIRYVDGAGEVVRGGGQVVKNAAGFDLPKLMVGSLGRYGALVELTFKVFPRPVQAVTMRSPWPTLAEAVAAMARTYTAPLDVDALDLWPSSAGNWEVMVRLAGPPAALPARLERIRPVVAGDAQVLSGEAESAAWSAMREMAWVPEGAGLVRVALSPAQLPGLNGALSDGHRRCLVRYSVGGNVAWVAVPEPHALDAVLNDLALPGLVVIGPPGRPLIGAQAGAAFERRVKAALDPSNKWFAGLGALPANHAPMPTNLHP
jgi:glycolate oxidase FAD binding subunit